MGDTREITEYSPFQPDHPESRFLCGHFDGSIHASSFVVHLPYSFASLLMFSKASRYHIHLAIHAKLVRRRRRRNTMVRNLFFAASHDDEIVKVKL